MQQLLSDTVTEDQIAIKFFFFSSFFQLDAE